MKLEGMVFQPPPKARARKRAGRKKQ